MALALSCVSQHIGDIWTHPLTCHKTLVNYLFVFYSSAKQTELHKYANILGDSERSLQADASMSNPAVQCNGLFLCWCLWLKITLLFILIQLNQVVHDCMVVVVLVLGVFFNKTSICICTLY